MAIPIPNEETPVSKRMRLNKEMKDSMELTESRKAMESMLGVNKNIYKVLDSTERISKKTLNAISSRLSGKKDDKVSKVIRGANVALKVIGDTEAALKAWRAQSLESTKRFQKQLSELRSDYEQASQLLEESKKNNDLETYSKLKKVLQKILEAQETLIKNREKALKYFDTNSFDKFSENFLDTFSEFKNLFKDLTSAQVNKKDLIKQFEKQVSTIKKQNDKSVDSLIKKIDNTISSINENKDFKSKKDDLDTDDDYVSSYERIAKVQTKEIVESQKNIEKSRKKHLDSIESKKEKREKQKELKQKSIEKKQVALEKSKARETILKENKIKESDKLKSEQIQKANAKKDVTKSDLQKIADRLERSFASRFDEDDYTPETIERDDVRGSRRKTSRTSEKREVISKGAKARKPKSTAKKVIDTGKGVVKGATTLAKGASALSGLAIAGGIAAGVASIAGANKAIESGLLGENLSSQYTIGDVISSWVGDGTRNLNRALASEKKKALDKADKEFKSFVGEAWRGVPKDRINDLKSTAYAYFLSEYYKLYMREVELRVIDTVLNTHRDSDKISSANKEKVHSEWKQAMQDRIKYKKMYIEKDTVLNVGEVETQDTISNDVLTERNKKIKEAERIKTSEAKSLYSSSQEKTNLNVNSNLSSGAIRFGDVRVPIEDKDNSDLAKYGLSQRKISSEVQNESLEDLENFLLKVFIPALADAISSRINISVSQQTNDDMKKTTIRKPVSPIPPIIYK